MAAPAAAPSGGGAPGSGPGDGEGAAASDIQRKMAAAYDASQRGDWEEAKAIVGAMRDAHDRPEVGMALLDLAFRGEKEISDVLNALCSAENMRRWVGRGRQVRSCTRWACSLLL